MEVYELPVNRRVQKINTKSGRTTWGRHSAGSWAAKQAQQGVDKKCGVAKKIGMNKELNQVDISEVYSPPRVTVAAKTMGLQVGDAMDWSWDFNLEEHRQQA